MKLYFAGNPGHGKAGDHREGYLIKTKVARMFSYFWFGEGKDFHKHFKRWIDETMLCGRRDNRDQL